MKAPEEHSWVSREERWCPTWPQRGCRWQAWPRTSTASGVTSLPSLLWALATRRLPSSSSASSTPAELLSLLSLLRLNQRRSMRCRHREQSCGHSEGRRGWGTESSTETYKLLHVKKIARRNLLCDSGSSNQALCDSLEGWNGVGGRFKSGETYVYLWLIHADVWQKPTKYCKSIILQ